MSARRLRVRVPGAGVVKSIVHEVLEEAGHATPKPVNQQRRQSLRAAGAALAGAVLAEVLDTDGPVVPEDVAAQIARAKADAAAAKAAEAEAEATNAELRQKISKARKALKKEDS